LSRRGFAIAAATLMLAACGSQPATKSPPAAQGPRTAPSGLDLVQLSIDSGSRTHRFTVEVARTEPQQAQGLMNRHALAPDAGMIFPLDPPRPASFWMRNTLIALDLIFIRPDGTIARIATGVPLSEEEIVVAESLTAVLEIPGGRAAQLGIRVGDHVSWSD
jgi:uncharacterized membrane protein (UPF0127 family)